MEKTEQAKDIHQEAWRAFQRDLARLWVERPGQWVAYQGAQQIGFAAQKHELYQQCFQRGFQRDQFVIFCVEPQEMEITLGCVTQE